MSTSTNEGVALRPIREPRSGRPKRADTMGVRGEPDWLEWLTRFADATSSSRQELLAVGVMKLAAEVGFEPPPPRL